MKGTSIPGRSTLGMSNSDAEIKSIEKYVVRKNGDNEVEIPNLLVNPMPTIRELFDIDSENLLQI